MRFKDLPLVAVAALLAMPVAGATFIEYTEGHHAIDVALGGEFAAAVLWADGSTWQGNAIALEAQELVVRYVHTDDFVATEQGMTYAGSPTHQNETLHNATVEAVIRPGSAYAALHGIGPTKVDLVSPDSIRTSPTDREVVEDRRWMNTKEPRSTDVTASLDVWTNDALNFTLDGGVSVNLWNWRVRITADEGIYEYSTGHQKRWSTAGVSTGPAGQIQLESSNAQVQATGVFDAEHHIWVRDAVVESDRMDLKLTDENLPTNRGVFTEKSRLTVLDITDTVTGNVTQALEPFNQATSSDPDTAPTTTKPLEESDGVAPTNDGPSTDSVAQDPAKAFPSDLQWALMGVTILVVGVFVAVRQFLGWPVQHLVPVAKSLHARAKDAAAVLVASSGHLLQPQEPRHRFHRGLAHYDQDHWRRAFRDMDWCQRRFEKFPKHRAVAAYTAARAAAQLQRASTAAALLMLAHHLNGKALWDADADTAFAPVRGLPQFEGHLVDGLGQ